MYYLCIISHSRFGETFIAMKKILIVAIAALLMAACETHNRERYVNGDVELIVDRTGGGDFSFTVVSSDSTGLLLCRLDRVHFNDTIAAFSLEKTSATEAAFRKCHSIIGGNFTGLHDCPIQNDTVLTGTWLNFYTVNGSDTLRITCDDVKDALSPLEGLAREYFGF